MELRREGNDDSATEAATVDKKERRMAGSGDR